MKDKVKELIELIVNQPISREEREVLSMIVSQEIKKAVQAH